MLTSGEEYRQSGVLTRSRARQMVTDVTRTGMLVARELPVLAANN